MQRNNGNTAIKIVEPEPLSASSVVGGLDSTVASLAVRATELSCGASSVALVLQASHDKEIGCATWFTLAQHILHTCNCTRTSSMQGTLIYGKE